MKHNTFRGASFLPVVLGAALLAESCTLGLNEISAPIFAHTERMDVSYNAGQFYFLPCEDVECVVLGIFQAPIATAGKSIVNMIDMKGGSCTGLSGFNRGQVSEDTLYAYSDEAKCFTGLPGGYNPSGSRYWAVWGFNSDWVIISSSQQMKTSFP
jgi:hypothetical protein